MNQELKHRLIGAVVITAIAAIFIPMLFDDPVDDTGKLVSELAIPAEPNNSAEEASSNKSPTSAEQVTERLSDEAGQTEESGQESVPESKDSQTEVDSTDGAAVDEAVSAETGQAKPSQSKETVDGSAENYVEEEVGLAPDAPENSLSKEEKKPNSLDTGIVEEAQVPKQAPKETIVSEEPVHSSPVKKIKPEKSLASDVEAPIKKAPVKASEVAKKSNPDSARWYVQAGSFGRKDNALTQLEILKKQGLPVTLETVRSSKGTFYRLKVGPELSKQSAAQIKAKLAKQKIKALLLAE